jgi:hypothetical protein
MRPVNKPFPPSELQPFVSNGVKNPAEIIRTALQDTIGFYCSFCEIPVKLEYGVESKLFRELKKTPIPSDWADLLLACDYCMVFRTSDAFDLSLYLWPDVDTTFSLVAPPPFIYTLQDVNVVIEEGEGARTETTEKLVIVSPNPAAGSTVEKKAGRTIDLFQLNTPFYNSVTNTYTVRREAILAAVDLRVVLRTDAWHEALYAIEQIAATDSPAFTTAMVRILTRLAQNTGFWSTWITAFATAGATPELIAAMFLEASDPEGLILTGYQTFGKLPYTIFTGTAVDRLLR